MTIQLPTAPAALVPEFSFGDRLRKARELAGFDRTELGEALGIHRQTIARYEADQARPTSSVVVVWGLITQVDLSWIQTGVCTPRDSNSEPTVSRRVSRRRPDFVTFATTAESIAAELGFES
jgi:transcriptional regulator with XRE-family HTH domain